VLVKTEQEWLDTMLGSLENDDSDNLKKLLNYSIRAKNFKETLEIFLRTKKELKLGCCGSIIESFKLLARELPIHEDRLSIAYIGAYLEQRLGLEKKELFRVIVELFFCMGYDKEIAGYITGFTDISITLKSS